MGTMASSTHQFGVLDLIRAGLQDLDTARTLLDELRADGIDDDRLCLLMKTLEQTCEPDIALRNLVDIIKALQSQGRDFHQVITDDAGLVRLVTVLGVSDEMGKLMRFRPELVMAAASDSCESHLYNHAQRRAHVLEAVGADPVDSRMPKATKPLAEAATALRQTYRKQLAAIMAQDATADDPIEIQPRISQELSDLADAALEGALAIARNEVDGSEHVRFAIIGMGKLGARELNYVSDVDLIYVVEPADADTNGMTLNRVGTKMATTLQRVCQSVIMGVAEPTLWQIDGGLRPEGKDGPLVRKLESHEAYYEQWAENWEFQALLKARPVAGDPDLGQAYMDMTRPFVWAASKRDNFVYDCQQMRKRVEDLIPAPLKDREIKLGRGGLRDVEFTVQMLQLVHGRADETLRTSSTLESLQRLAEGGYVSRRQAKKLSWDYRFERVMEHRQQMWALKRTHLFPDLGKASLGGIERKRDTNDDELNHNLELRRLARAFHMHPEELVDKYDETRREVRHLHMDIYYRPMLPINAGLDDEQVELSANAMQERFASIGFADPDAAMRHVTALTAGISRAAKINRILLPAALQWLGEGRTPTWDCSTGANSKNTLARTANTSASCATRRPPRNACATSCPIRGSWATRSTNPSNPSPGSAAATTCSHAHAKASTCRHTPHSNATQAASTTSPTPSAHATPRNRTHRTRVDERRHRRQGVARGYDRRIRRGHRRIAHLAIRHQTQEMGLDEAPAAIAVIGMGRYGGREVNFSSDADVIIIYRPSDNADDNQANLFARKVQEDLRAILQGPTTLEPKIELDMDLRPEGKNGPLVRSYASCEEYYRSWASTWEHQALLRARYAAGDAALAEDFLMNVADPLRYPKID